MYESMLVTVAEMASRKPLWRGPETMSSSMSDAYDAFDLAECINKGSAYRQGRS